MTDWQPTTCMRCAVGCGLQQQDVADGRGVGDARGNPSHPTNSGDDCQRGIRETVDPGSERLTQPLVRRGGTLQPADWDTAIGIVATRFIEALRNDTGDVAVLGSGQQTNEAAYALGKVARGGLGTPYYDANTRLCMASAVEAYNRAFGGNAPPPTYDDIPAAETHLVWGANPAAAHPVLYRWIANSASREGSRLVVVDPVESATARDADTHIQLEPGTDLALARAVMAHVVDAGAVDTAFVEAQTSGFEQLVESLPDIETAAATAGVPTEQIAELADALSAPTLLYWGMGVNQSVQGTATARALIDCCLATGNLGPGTGPFSLTGQANSMGSRVSLSKQNLARPSGVCPSGNPKAGCQTLGRPAQSASVRSGPRIRRNLRCSRSGRYRRLLDGRDEPGLRHAGCQSGRNRPRRCLPRRTGFVSFGDGCVCRRRLAGRDVGRMRGHYHEYGTARLQGHRSDRSA